jgi:hypothetical protein
MNKATGSPPSLGRSRPGRETKLAGVDVRRTLRMAGTSQLGRSTKSLRSSPLRGAQVEKPAIFREASEVEMTA